MMLIFKQNMLNIRNRKKCVADPSISARLSLRDGLWQLSFQYLNTCCTHVTTLTNQSALQVCYFLLLFCCYCQGFVSKIFVPSHFLKTRPLCKSSNWQWAVACSREVLDAGRRQEAVCAHCAKLLCAGRNNHANTFVQRNIMQNN